MRITLLALLTATSVFACSQGPDPDPTSSSTSSRLGGDGGAPAVPGNPGVPSVPGVPSLPSIDAGACAPTVQASAKSCSITIDATTCDCTDATCITGAVGSCLGIDASVPPLPSLDGGAGVGVGTGAGCTQADIDAAKQQFCSDVDSVLAADGLASVKIDCTTIGQPPASFTPPANIPTGGIACGDITQAAAATAAKALAACDPAAYLTWDPTARLQLFADGACMLP
jgi:hypothetical protein